MENTKRTLAEKMSIFKGLFMGLRNAYGTYDIKTDRVRQVKEPVTDEVIVAHLTGKQSYGVYLLTGNKIDALVVDFDENELHLPVSFTAIAARYNMPAYIERSKSKGYHVWVFFEDGGVVARKARLVAQKILADMGRQKTEVFPKQDALTDGVSYGNFINAPLFGALVPKGRTVFVDPAEPANPCPDQWGLLERIQRVPETKLDSIIEDCNLTEQIYTDQRPESTKPAELDHDTSPFGLPPCIRRMLKHGVTSYQRVSCFRMAVQLKRNGMPYDLTVVVLKAWAQKNHPAESKRTITDSEIEYQAKCAYAKPYRSFGCEDPAVAIHCDKACPMYAHTVGKSSGQTQRNHDASL